MRVRQAVHRPCGEVRELTPHQVARCAVLVASLRAHAGLGFRLDVIHRCSHRVTEGVEHPLVPCQPVEQRDALRCVEVEVVADAAFRLAAHGQRLAGIGAEVVAEPIPVTPIDGTREPEHGGALAAPEADEFLALGVVVRRAVVALGPTGAVALCHAQHRSILPQKPCHPVNAHTHVAESAHSNRMATPRLRGGCVVLATSCRRSRVSVGA